MKLFNKISFIILALAGLTLSSCLEVELSKYEEIAEGEPAQVSLTFDVQSSPEVTTRAAQSTYYEYLVQNLYVFVFNNGYRVDLSKDFFQSSVQGDILDYKNKQDQAGNNESSGNIVFESISGSRMTICAIANIGTSNSSLTVDDVKDIQTYEQLQALSAGMTERTISRGASFLMTGEVETDLIPGETTKVTLPLKRTDSKITFNVTSEAVAGTGISDIKFIPGKWRVVNVPAKTYVLQPNVTPSSTLEKDMDATTSQDFFSIAEDQMPQFEGTVNGADNSGTFTFYMYENLKRPSETITDYALREKQTKTPTDSPSVPGQRFVNGEFVNAPQYATYVVFTGELSYTQQVTEGSTTRSEYVMADVEYCVHLGHAGTSNVNDYSTLRNHHYTYNVKVTGVNSLIVEVESNVEGEDIENRPGAEGDVVISATEIINVDGHYDRALITLTDEEAQKMYFATSTPWERGLDANGFADSKTMKDYKWVKFLINKDVNVATNRYAAFPGEQCYDGGATVTGTAANSSIYNMQVALRDIRQLSKYLANDANREASMSSDGKIYITVFIDEYIYYYNPTGDPLGSSTTYKGLTSTDPDLTLWKKSVNQNDRMLHIVKAGDMNYSADGETSLSRSVVTVKQRSILTFYNVNAEGLNTAWGTETINETPRLPVNRSSYPSTSGLNSYQTAQRLTSNVDRSTANTWAGTIGNEQQYQLLRQDPSYACAMRNRDLDGDGTIDQNEVQWYLTSLEQLTDLWVGEPAMPAYAHLFDEDNPDGYYNDPDYNNAATPATHFASSTIASSSPYIYWAEEYGATSTHANAISWRKAPRVNNEYVVSVRCVRNLGQPYTSTALPQSYVQVNGNEFDLNFINPTALRTNPDKGGSLPYSDLNATNENNRPYSAFEVGDRTSQSYGWYSAYQRELAQNSYCPDGYRMPNQREMIMMSSRIDGWNNYTYLIYNGQTLANRTSSNFGAFYFYSGENRISRTLSNGMTYQTSSARIRCVRDVTE